MTPSEALKNPRSKPSWTSINSTAKPIPALDRTSRRLLATRLRQASGTGRVSVRVAIASWATPNSSEDLGGIGAAQPAQRQKGRDPRHQQRGRENAAQQGRT